MELPVELFLALRYLRPRRSFVSVITILSFLGVTLGVLVLIVVLSVMTGFQQRLSEKIIGFNAHITVAMADGAVMYDYDKAIEQIKKDPEVLAASPVIRGPVLVQFHDRMTPAFIKSVPMEGDDPVLPLKQYVKMGDYELRGDSIIVGSQWSRLNGAFPGDKIDVFGPTFLKAFADQKAGIKGDIPLPEEPVIRGVFQTGQFDYDMDFLLVSTEMAQHIWGMPNAVHGIAVRVKDPDRATEVRDRLNNNLPKTLNARTWMDDNRDLFNAIDTERAVMAFILFFVMLVAAFGLCSTLITITMQKSREIGLMKALGASDLQVLSVFLFHGVVVGVVGAVGGTIAGLVILHFRNPFRDVLSRLLHIQIFPASVYKQTDIPAVIDPLVVTLIAISAVAICTLAALIPALNAARLAPARALRYE